MEEAAVSVYVSLARAAATIFWYLLALGSLVWLLASESSFAADFNVLLSCSTVLGAGIAMHAFGRCVHMMMLAGQNVGTLVQRCNGTLDPNAKNAVREHRFTVAAGFIGFVLQNSSLLLVWVPVTKKFFTSDIPFNWHQVWNGSDPGDPYVNFLTQEGFWTRAVALFGLVVLDSMGLVFISFAFAAPVVVETILVLPGALIISILVLIVYARNFDDNQIHLQWRQLITCNGCDVYHPLRDIRSCVRCNFNPINPQQLRYRFLVGVRVCNRTERVARMFGSFYWICNGLRIVSVKGNR